MAAVRRITGFAWQTALTIDYPERLIDAGQRQGAI